MPVLPLVGSTNLLARAKQAPFFGIPDHGRADATLDRVRGIAAFDLGEHRGISRPSVTRLS